VQEIGTCVTQAKRQKILRENQCLLEDKLRIKIHRVPATYKCKGPRTNDPDRDTQRRKKGLKWARKARKCGFANLIARWKHDRTWNAGPLETMETMCEMEYYYVHQKETACKTGAQQLSQRIDQWADHEYVKQENHGGKVNDTQPTRTMPGYDLLAPLCQRKHSSWERHPPQYSKGKGKNRQTTGFSWIDNEVRGDWIDQTPPEKWFHDQSDQYYSSGPQDNKKNWYGQKWSGGWQSRNDEWDKNHSGYKGRKVYRGDDISDKHSADYGRTQQLADKYWDKRDAQQEEDKEHHSKSITPRAVIFEHRKDDKEHHSKTPQQQQAQAYKTSQRTTPYSRNDQRYDVYDGTPSATAAGSSVPAPFPQTPGHEDPLADLRTEDRSFASRG